MKRIFWGWLLALSLLPGTAPPVLADARSDLRIEIQRDEDQDLNYVLKNVGDGTIEAEIEVHKDCTGNDPKPVVRTYWLGPGQSKKIGHEWSGSSCPREYRIRKAVRH